MTSPQPVAPRRVRQYRGLLGRCAFLVPAVIFGAWRLAGAQEGPHGGDMAPFLVAFAAILVAAKVGGELVERLGQPAVLGELLVGVILGNFGLLGFELFDASKSDPFLPIAAEIGVMAAVPGRSRVQPQGIAGRGSLGRRVALLGVVAPVALGYAVSSAFLPGDVAWYVHLFAGAPV